jgi:hypothetical protein
MRRKFIIAAVISLIVISSTVGIWIGLQSGAKEKINLFTYPLSVGDRTFIVTVETNWSEEREPSVSLLNSSDSRYAIELYFLGGTLDKTVSFEISIPTDLLWGNISLIRKYYLVDPDSYSIINNGTCNLLQMTFEYQPFFSGNGYFEIVGTEGAW